MQARAWGRKQPLPACLLSSLHYLSSLGRSLGFSWASSLGPLPAVLLYEFCPCRGSGKQILQRQHQQHQQPGTVDSFLMRLSQAFPGEHHESFWRLLQAIRICSYRIPENHKSCSLELELLWPTQQLSQSVTVVSADYLTGLPVLVTHPLSLQMPACTRSLHTNLLGASQFNHGLCCSTFLAKLKTSSNHTMFLLLENTSQL